MITLAAPRRPKRHSFLKQGAMIVAPSLQLKISYAGDTNRRDVNHTQADLYFVWRPTKTS